MIGITAGDPNGVGPEILLKTYLEKNEIGNSFVIGDLQVLHFSNQRLDFGVSLHQMQSPKDWKEGSLNVFDLAMFTEKDLTIGEISQKGGSASLKYIEKATEMALDRSIEAIVTLPINKEAVRLSRKDFQGHTDYIASLSGARNYTMMLVSEALIVTHVSMHVSMKEALKMIRKEHIAEVIRLTHEALSRLRPMARIAVAGLNPHAGEHGAFGKEEILEIGPAVEITRSEGMQVEGPLPPDTLFYQAVKGKYDAVVCMYHDQGHIPLKLLAFEDAVNMTLGLPIIRTSVDHGTAFDIAWQGKASIKSFYNALDLADRMVHFKKK
jgi:4-hydroxythreonine-4-phosphate dehydrogenase